MTEQVRGLGPLRLSPLPGPPVVAGVT